jgi:hypothetical protein
VVDPSRVHDGARGAERGAERFLEVSGQFSGPLMPRPPDTMMSASETSSSFDSEVSTRTTRVRGAIADSSSVSTRGSAVSRASAGKTFGRVAATCSAALPQSTSARALPE